MIANLKFRQRYSVIVHISSFFVLVGDITFEDGPWNRKRKVAGTMESFVRPNNARYRRILYPTIGSRRATSRYNNTVDRFRYCCKEKAGGLSDDLARFIVRRKRTWLLCEKCYVLSRIRICVNRKFNCNICYFNDIQIYI